MVGEHLHAARPGLVDARRARDGESPVVGPERFHVTDDAHDLRFFGDANHFLHGGDDPDAVVALVPDVARIQAAGFAGDPRERDHLFGRGERARHVVQTARQPVRALAHAGADQRLHPGHLGLGRLAIRRSQHGRPDAAVPDEQHHVDAGAAAFQLGALRREIDRPAAVRVGDDGRDALSCLRAFVANRPFCLSVIHPVRELHGERESAYRWRDGSIRG